MPGYRARRRRTPDVTRIGPVRGGRCGRSRRSWLIPGIRGGRCGTGSRRRRSWSIRRARRWGISRCSGGTCPRAGSSRNIPRTPRWSAKPTSSPPRTPPRRAARPGRGPPVPAGRAHHMRAVRAPAGISLVLRPGCLPVPPRLHQRHRPRSRPPEERLCPRGPDPAAPGRPRHPAGRPRRDTRPKKPQPGKADRPRRHGSAHRPASRRWHRPHLRPRWPDPVRRRSRRALGHHRHARCWHSLTPGQGNQDRLERAEK